MVRVPAPTPEIPAGTYRVKIVDVGMPYDPDWAEKTVVDVWFEVTAGKHRGKKSKKSYTFVASSRSALGKIFLAFYPDKEIGDFDTDMLFDLEGTAVMKTNDRGYSNVIDGGFTPFPEDDVEEPEFETPQPEKEETLPF
jgi:hypothetical protein